MNETYQGPQKTSLFSYAALIMGILALLSICTGFFPLIFGSLGILFVVLGTKKGQYINNLTWAGICTSVTGMIFALGLLIVSISMIPSLLRDPAQRDYMNRMSEQLYGQSFDDMMKEYYGIDLDEYFPPETPQSQPQDYAE